MNLMFKLKNNITRNFYSLTRKTRVIDIQAIKNLKFEKKAKPMKKTKLKAVSKFKSRIQNILEERKIYFKEIRSSIEKDTESRYNKLININTPQSHQKIDYYIPLSQKDILMAEQYFNPKSIQLIKLGGKAVLHEELKYIGVNFEKNFVPISKEQIEFIRAHFNDLYNNDACRKIILRMGQAAYKSLLQYYLNKTKKMKNLETNLNFMNDTLYILKGKHPYSNKSLKLFNLLDKDAYCDLLSFLKKELNIDLTNLTTMFKEINQNYIDFLNSEMSLNKQVDEKLLNKSTAFLNYYSHKGLKFKLSKIDISPDFEDKLRLVDVKLIKGVSTNRKLNDFSENYTYIHEFEKQGVRIFEHKTNNLDNNNRLILRIGVSFKSKYIIKGEKYPEDYNYVHFAIFENELLLPNFKMIKHSENYLDYIKEYKYQPSNWKLVDFDNFLEGNSFFSDMYSINHSKLLYNSTFFPFLDENISKLYSTYIYDAYNLPTNDDITQDNLYSSKNELPKLEKKGKNDLRGSYKIEILQSLNKHTNMKDDIRNSLEARFKAGCKNYDKKIIFSFVECFKGENLILEGEKKTIDSIFSCLDQIAKR